MIIDLTKWRTGFCDRLTQITFCITVAKLRGDKTLYIKANKTKHCPYDFVDVCLVNGFSVHSWSDNIMGSVEWRMDYDTVTPNWLKCAVFPDIDAARLHKPCDITISNCDFLDQWFQSYTLIVPKAHIAAKIEYLGLSDETLGLHIRRTDKIKNGISYFHGYRIGAEEKERRTKEKVLSCLIEPKGSVFLASDNEHSKEEWTFFLRDNRVRVISNAAIFFKERFRQTSAEDFIVDLFSLSKCKHIIGSGESSVIRAAAYIGGRKSWSLALPI